jgi:hypothetical protein
LRDALAAAERYYGVTLRPHDAGKWFRIYYPTDHLYHEPFAKRRVNPEFELVDLHMNENFRLS